MFEIMVNADDRISPEGFVWAKRIDRTWASEVRGPVARFPLPGGYRNLLRLVIKNMIVVPAC